MTTLPEKFVQRLYQIWPQVQADGILASLTTPTRPSFRVNTLKSSDDTILAQLADIGVITSPIEGIDHAYSTTTQQRDKLTHSDAFNQGLIYIQNPSSMLASLVLNPEPGEEILDLAAAPGGKCLHLAALMGNSGRIAAVEINKSRFHRLKNNIELATATNIYTYLKDGAKVGRDCPERFERVLLDAPCSSETRFDPNDANSYAYWSEKKIKAMVRKQKQLAYSAVLALKPKGTLVYTTCTFAPEENEGIVQYLLDKFPDKLTIEEITIPTKTATGLSAWQTKTFHPDLTLTHRVIPNNIYKGFYIAKLVKI